MGRGARATSRRATLSVAVGLLAAGGALLAPPASADWLVTRDGTAVETDGPWEERGRLVVFTRTDGTLASLRASEVDLEASRRRTAAAATRAERGGSAPPAERRRSVARLTEEDLPNAGRLERAPEPEGEETATAPEEREPIEVIDWRDVSGVGGDGLELMGTIRNTTADTAVQVRLAVEVYDQEGDLLGSTQALLTSSALAPDATATFRASLPGVYAFDEVRFDAGATRLAQRDDGG